MAIPIEHLTLAIPLTAANREQARQLAQLQINQAAADRVYRNTLAVLATAQYLQMLGIKTKLEASYSWNPAIHLIADVGDLYLPEKQARLECRPVGQDDQSCYIPEEVWDNRLGFVVVQLNADYTQANLLGFVPEVSVEYLPLSYLRSLDDLIDAIEDAPAPVTVLSDWLRGVVSDLWQPLSDFVQYAADPLETLRPDTLGFRGRSRRFFRGVREPLWVRGVQEPLWEKVRHLYGDQTASETDRVTIPESLARQGDSDEAAIAALAHLVQNTASEIMRFRAAELLWTVAPNHPAAGVQHLFDLSDYFVADSLGLMVAVLPRSQNRFSILARVYPLATPYLPPAVELSVLDETGQRLFGRQSAPAQDPDPWVGFPFIVSSRDAFSLQVIIGTQNFSQNFLL